MKISPRRLDSWTDGPLQFSLTSASCFFFWLEEASTTSLCSRPPRGIERNPNSWWHWQRKGGEERWHSEDGGNKDWRGCDVVFGDSFYVSRFKNGERWVEEN